jgi:hypothetical protein
VTGDHLYDAAGVHTITLTVTDAQGASDEAIFQYMVVYDPDGGSVTGGGWINSLAGAYPSDPSLTGKANFGFVSKYKKGANTPTGQTEFNFRVADLNFHSDSYDWLVVAGHKAMYKGVGTINGAGSYGFMLSAIDEALTPSTDVDLFRIKIWDKDNGDVVVYDNQLGDADDADPTTAIGGGSIVIHKEDGGGQAKVVPAHVALFQNLPNPFNPTTQISYALAEDVPVRLAVYNLLGQSVITLVDEFRTAGHHIVTWDASDVSAGVYLYRLEAGSFVETKRMVLIK